MRPELLAEMREWVQRAVEDLREAEQDLVAAHDPSLADVVDRAAELTPYAWRFRYPSTPAVPTMDEAREALMIAREVCGAVLARLPGETHP
jgi:HEPN domain-containing protein